MNPTEGLEQTDIEAQESGVVSGGTLVSRKGSTWVGGLLSLIVHTTLLMVLALYTLQFDVAAPTTISASISNGDEMATLSLEASSSSTSSSQATQSLAATQELPLAERPEVTLDGTQALEGLTLESTQESLGVPTTAQLVSAISRDGIATGFEGRYDSSSEKGVASFFGSKAYGTKFVFVIDASTSMTGYRWNRAVRELLNTIEDLDDGTQFYVVAFHFGAVPFHPERLVGHEYLVKDRKSKEEVRKWLRFMELGADTMPASALEIALGFKPDAIFFMSDGELNDDSRWRLRKFNQKSGNVLIPVHTIHLFSPFGRDTLKAIAQENGGTFTAVTGD